MARKYIDCRESPSVTNCSLRIEGEEEEVLRAAEEHAISVHGEQRSPQLRDYLRRALKNV